MQSSDNNNLGAHKNRNRKDMNPRLALPFKNLLKNAILKPNQSLISLTKLIKDEVSSAKSDSSSGKNLQDGNTTLQVVKTSKQ